MTKHNALEERFAELPARATRSEIATATGRTVEGVQNWINAYEDFPPVVDKRGRFGVRNSNDVLAWLLRHGNLLQENRRGPRGDLVERTREARHGTEVSVAELAAILGVGSRTVSYYATSAPEDCPDPFPAATSRDGGRGGKRSVRSWPAVRSWLLRTADPLPKGDLPWEDLQRWLLAVYEVDKDDESLGHDEHGLTMAQRDVLERVRTAKAAGHQVPARWTAQMLDVSGPKAVAELLTASVRPAPLAGRLGMAALAREVGVPESTLRRYADRHPAGSADPFPAKDSNGLRDVAYVRAWLGVQRPTEVA